MSSDLSKLREITISVNHFGVRNVYSLRDKDGSDVGSIRIKYLMSWFPLLNFDILDDQGKIVASVRTESEAFESLKNLFRLRFERSPMSSILDARGRLLAKVDNSSFIVFDYKGKKLFRIYYKNYPMEFIFRPIIAKFRKYSSVGPFNIKLIKPMDMIIAISVIILAIECYIGPITRSLYRPCPLPETYI